MVMDIEWDSFLFDLTQCWSNDAILLVHAPAAPPYIASADSVDHCFCSHSQPTLTSACNTIVDHSVHIQLQWVFRYMHDRICSLTTLHWEIIPVLNSAFITDPIFRVGSMGKGVTCTPLPPPVSYKK